MAQPGSRVPALMFSHFGVYCSDYEVIEDFYARVLGFAVTDSGLTSGGGRMAFMSRRPREHHQFAIGDGRPPGLPSTINQTGFKAPDLAELRRIHDLVSAEPGVSAVALADHGISWTLYFRDPEGNRVSVSVETGLYVPQPAVWPLDLSLDDSAVAAETRQRCESRDGFMTRGDWAGQTRAMLKAGGQLTGEATPTGDPAPLPGLADDPDRVLLDVRGSATPPRIAMSHVGFYVTDLDTMAEFYTRVLGYHVSGRGRMGEIGPEPACDVVYLTRDPGEHQQVMLCSGRAADTPSSVQQLSLRLTSLDELRHMETVLKTDPGVTSMRYVNHGNSFSIYFGDPEGNPVELAVESVWYFPAPSGWRLDLSLSDAELVRTTAERCVTTPGAMMRADWKSRAREEFIANGHLECEGLVSHVA